MGIFLDHASRRARDPNVVVLVEVAGVKAEGRGTVAKPRDGDLDQTGIAPGMNHFTAGIELDHQRRKTPGIQFAVQHVLRLRRSTWSWASMQWPPNPPVTHRFVNGFGK